MSAESPTRTEDEQTPHHEQFAKKEAQSGEDDDESQTSASLADDNNKAAERQENETKVVSHPHHRVEGGQNGDNDESGSKEIRGLISLLYGGEPASLANWSQKSKNGVIRRVLDAEINAYAVELIGSNVSTTFINMPPGLNQNMNLDKPVLVMIVKNMKKFFAFEVMVLDNFNIRRKFRASTSQTITRLKQFLCLMPLRLEKKHSMRCAQQQQGWNQVVFNLPDFVKRAYGTEYLCTLRLQVHANCRLRRIYFCDRPYAEEEPLEFQLYRRNNGESNNGGTSSSAYDRATSHDSAEAKKQQRKRIVSPT